MAQWNNNTVPKCKDRTCSDEVVGNNFKIWHI